MYKLYINQVFHLKISHLIQLPYGAVLAPMAGFTDSPFRRLARRYGAGLLYSECISAEGLRRLGAASLALCRFHPDERPIAIQLFGSSPEPIAEAAMVVVECFKPDIIDVNCGCPVRKMVARGCGGDLMQHPERIGRIVEAVAQAVRIPVSVKLRAGWTPKEETAPEAALAAEAAGAAFVAVHGRFVRNAKGSLADWEVIGRVKTTLKRIPVIGNGDIFSPADAERMLHQTGCDRVMVGRWALGKPWVFQALKDVAPPLVPPRQAGGRIIANLPRRAGGRIDTNLSCTTEEINVEIEFLDPSFDQRIDILIEHLYKMVEHYDERTAILRMRRQIGWYLSGMPDSAKLKKELMLIAELNLLINRLMDYKKRYIL